MANNSAIMALNNNLENLQGITSGDFQFIRNIGKVQPMNEIKHLNESLIRSKLNRGGGIKPLESPLKYD